jgi:hypothetical protein
MKQSIQLHIPDPCHEGWEKMTPNEQGRFCMSCQKTVVDFSVMTDKQILHYIANASGNTCGRVHNDQLNRVIASGKKRYSFKYFWSLLITSALISSRASAQGQIKTANLTCVKPDTMSPAKKDPAVIRLGRVVSSGVKDQVAYQVKGLVVDAENRPVYATSVMIKGTEYGTLTDSNGRFTLKGKADMLNAVLVIASAGHKAEEIKLSPDMIENVHVEKPVVILQIKTVVISQVPEVMGKMIVVEHAGRKPVPDRTMAIKPTLLSKTKTFFSNLTSSNNIRVYPNPMTANGNFSLWLNVKETGEYTVEFIDVSGQVVLVKALTIAFKGQLQAFNGSELKGSGTYFVRVKGKDNKTLYHAKLVVQ